MRMFFWASKTYVKNDLQENVYNCMSIFWFILTCEWCIIISWAVFFAHRWTCSWWTRKRIHYCCEGRIEKSALQDHRLSSLGSQLSSLSCRVMTITDPVGQVFLSHPHTHDGFENRGGGGALLDSVFHSVCHKFVSIQYLENKLIEFYQIVYALIIWYWIIDKI